MYKSSKREEKRREEKPATHTHTHTGEKVEIKVLPRLRFMNKPNDVIVFIR